MVLTLLGLMAALVGPPLQRTYDSVVGSGERDEVRRQIESLPLKVRQTGTLIDLPAGSDGLQALLDLPEGWQIETAQPLRIELSGVCRPGQLIVRGRGQQWRFELSSPYCQVAYAP